MAGRILLFWATGYTGRLVADALGGQGGRPGPAPPRAGKLEEMAEEPGRLETHTPGVARPQTGKAAPPLRRRASRSSPHTASTTGASCASGTPRASRAST